MAQWTSSDVIMLLFGWLLNQMQISPTATRATCCKWTKRAVSPSWTMNWHLQVIVTSEAIMPKVVSVIYILTLITSSLSWRSLFMWRWWWLASNSILWCWCWYKRHHLGIVTFQKPYHSTNAMSVVICLACMFTLPASTPLPSLIFTLLMSIVCLTFCNQKSLNGNKSNSYSEHHRNSQSSWCHRHPVQQNRVNRSVPKLSHYSLCLLISCLLPRTVLTLISPGDVQPSGQYSRNGASAPFGSLPRPSPLNSESSNSSQICPLLLYSYPTESVPQNISSSTSSIVNPCLCYGTGADGIFIECTSASISQVESTLNFLKPSKGSVHSLTIYRLNESRITTLPDSLFRQFSSIKELHISSTNLTRMGSDQTFAGLGDSLHTLSFVNSKISTIPKSTLSKLKQLSSLDVQANQISNLESYVFYGLPLKTLNLQNNIIASLHEFAFGGLENTLEELSLIGNKLENFPLFALRRLRKLQSLKLQSNLISQIPDDGFTRFTVLETLDLQSNQIRHLSSRSFVTMPKLKTLYCSNNLLTVVSDSSIFVQLHHLETLDLSLNRLRVVNLNGLESIRTLDLSYNHLHDLRLQGMSGLRELFASHNNILQLVNETFLNTTALEVLYLQHNSIHSITYNAFHRLTELRVLDLSFNQLSGLHSALFKHTSQLESLYLDNNHISDSGLTSGIFQELVSGVILFPKFLSQFK